MKITEIKGWHLRLPVVTEACDGTQDTLVVQVHTDTGLVGYGEVDSCPSVAKAIIEAPLSHQICNGLANLLRGEDPLALEALDRKMYEGTLYFGRWGVVRHAMAGINMALWDLRGKALGQPVYKLLGGPFQTRFRAYASVLFEDTPAATGERARQLIDQGFTAVKFGWGPMGQDEATDLALVREARRGLGEAADLMVDAGLVWDWKTALRRAQQFAEYNLFWLEEPLPPEDLAGYRQLCARSPVRIAAGEQESDPEGFERLLEVGRIDVVQPDPARCGISGMHRVAQAAARRRRLVANHTFKSGISIAASLHVLAAIPNAICFEYCMAESPLRHDLTVQKFPLDGEGWVQVPDAPGLGIDLNQEVMARYVQ